MVTPLSTTRRREEPTRRQSRVPKRCVNFGGATIPRREVSPIALPPNGQGRVGWRSDISSSMGATQSGQDS